jgi:hypothetical protein
VPIPAPSWSARHEICAISRPAVGERGVKTQKAALDVSSHVQIRLHKTCTTILKL